MRFRRRGRPGRRRSGRRVMRGRRFRGKATRPYRIGIRY